MLMQNSFRVITKKAALVEKCKKVGINCFVKDKPGEMLLTRKALEEEISVFF